MTPKFRAWLKQFNKMVIVTGMGFEHKSSDVEEIFIYDQGNPYDSCPEEPFLPYEFVLMQSTGVLDDNGVEIFEDDIVIAEGKRGFVMWENGGFQVTIYDGLGYHIDEYQSLLKIGNTFENPELLEEVAE
jgi:uncharacterized phage protein (TIGR01671 family)